MPDKKNRNSREDKSLNNNRFQSGSNSNRSESSNTDRKKKFEGDSQRSFKSRSDKPESRDSSTKKHSRSSEDKPFSTRQFSGSNEKPYGKSDRPFASKTGPNKKYSEERSFDKRSTEERSFEKKSFSSEKGRSDRKPVLGEKSFEKRSWTGEKKNFDKPRGESSFGKKPFAGEGRKFGKEGERSFDKKLYSKSNSGLPYERKPYKSKSENRTWTSEEKIDQPNTRARKKTTSSDSELIRLNRYIANAGICSRRKADELIEAGVISVNGEVVSELGFKVNPC